MRPLTRSKLRRHARWKTCEQLRRSCSSSRNSWRQMAQVLASEPPASRRARDRLATARHSDRLSGSGGLASSPTHCARFSASSTLASLRRRCSPRTSTSVCSLAPPFFPILPSPSALAKRSCNAAAFTSSLAGPVPKLFPAPHTLGISTREKPRPPPRPRQVHSLPLPLPLQA